MSKKDDKPTGKPKFDIKINEFGEIEHGFDIDKINEYLNENTTDWRIKSEEDDYREEEE